MSEIRKFDKVVLNYKVGYVNDVFQRGGQDYVDVRFDGGASSVAPIKSVIPLGVFMDAARRSELEICQVCHGRGRIDPVENPAYKCDACDGRGCTVIH